ncbi:uncharacterized protein J3D65DRAFT_619458 [Phyllosticta citribraziliensis]|uniref:Secreted protein n=1 Tax=Phyllosticta citribraziliensis TaxID=989973 RepID=A0ABR1M0W7_9PEZI
MPYIPAKFPPLMVSVMIMMRGCWTRSLGEKKKVGMALIYLEKRCVGGSRLCDGRRGLVEPRDIWDEGTASGTS